MEMVIASSFLGRIPIESIVVPSWGYLIRILNRSPKRNYNGADGLLLDILTRML